MSKWNSLGRACLLLALSAAAVTACRCEGPRWPVSAPPRPQPVPPSLRPLLPRRIRIHSFTGTRHFGDAGGIKGIDVRIEAIDGYGDAGKAFGTFRFELFAFKPNNPDPKGPRIAVWTVNVEDPKINRQHWNSIMRTYQFKLGWDRPIAVGRKFVLTAVLQSRFVDRLFDQRVFVSGQ